MTKKCTKCAGVKELGEFYAHPSSGGRPSARCKACMKAAQHSRNARVRSGRKPHTTKDLLKNKVCSACEVKKPRSAFSENSALKDGLQKRCRDCLNTYERERIARLEMRPHVEVPARKRCPLCSTEKPADAFRRYKGSKDGLRGLCKDCHYVSGREKMLLKTYGMSAEEYEERFAAQGGVCAICGQPETQVDKRSGNVKRLSVDHCHKSGAVRDLLCSACNTALGHGRESVRRFSQLARYVLRHRKNAKLVTI